MSKKQLTLEERLQAPMEYKWRLQSAKYGKATVVAYIDSRQVQDRLDEVFGVTGWSDEYREIGGNLYCGITIIDPDTGERVTKWDVGTESNIEKEKGNSSDAFKRSAVKLGVGRFLYSLSVITLRAVTHTNNKEYPATKEGKILWSPEEIFKYCQDLYNKGIYDDTKTSTPPVNKSPKVAPKAPVKAPLTDKDPKIKDIIEGLKLGTFTVEDIKKTRTLTAEFEKKLKGFEKK